VYRLVGGFSEHSVTPLTEHYFKRLLWTWFYDHIAVDQPGTFFVIALCSSDRSDDEFHSLADHQFLDYAAAFLPRCVDHMPCAVFSRPQLLETEQGHRFAVLAQAGQSLWFPSGTHQRPYHASLEVDVHDSSAFLHGDFVHIYF